ncbi:FGGY-family pentulose kinase [Candida albicans SC5314]|nr:FGGY-family pentulose kinase [Candida albicans SC5314]KHC86689.1 FGGY-family pentulose kinase [Candida albicans SC5314]
MVQNKSNLSLANRRQSSFFRQLPPAEPDVYYIGVDVGTGSARACLIDTNGIILGLAERPIKRQELEANYITQNSTEIWEAICYCVRSCLRDSGVQPEDVFGIGFDATCSLVAISESTDQPVSVGPNFKNDKDNIILWMDHRAVDETNAINATNDKCLKYVGGQMSIEMELPKMKWLKHHKPGGIKDCKFYDLPDYLVHKATGTETRSYCSVVCKQGFVPIGVEDSETGWSEEFLSSIDMPELVEDNFRRLGGIPGKNGKYLTAGDPVGNLTPEAAEKLGLTTECVVGSPVIDAYAGWVGTVAAKADVPALQDEDAHSDGSIGTACGRLAAVAGTSTCHLAMTKEPCFVQGVWGPYKNVMAEGYWLAEGGQSITGQLLAHVLATHPANHALIRNAEQSNISKFEYLNSLLEDLVKDNNERSPVSLARHMFFYGDFHGNRSPIADPRMRGSIIGQSMDNSLHDLAIQYFGACEFIAQQTRQIIEEMEKSGHKISCIFMSGGQSRNGLLMRLLADCTGLPVIIPRYIDAAVVFGASLLGAVAAEEAVAEHCRDKAKSRRSSLFGKGSHTNLKDRGSTSPYTAPSATSTTNLSMLAYAESHQGQAQLTPMNEETDYFNQAAQQKGGAGEHHNNAIKSDDESDDDATLSFGSKQQTQKGLSQKLASLNLKPLTSSTKSNAPGAALWKVMKKMTGPGKVINPHPDDNPERRLLNVKYKVFLEQCYSQRKFRDMVDKIELENAELAKKH